jgi:uncharacterized protein with NAD-binding domain and iron-sulfur cluster
MSGTERAPRIAILGGGPAGLAAAWHLIHADPNLEITVYQQGWRLGGKGAASRGPAGRIEEHGIHLFGNFYGNALGIVRAAYAETGRSLDEALLPNNLHLSIDLASDSRFSSRVSAATVESTARGDDNVHPELLWPKLLEAAIESTVGLTPIPSGPPSRRRRFGAWVRRVLTNALTGNVTTRATTRRLAALAPDAAEVEVDAAEYAKVVASITRWRRWVVTPLGWLRSLGAAGRLRHAQADLLFTALAGALTDEVFTRGIDRIDGEDHLAWLERHGAAPTTLRSEAATTIPNICFQYPAGDTTAGSSMSAAAFLTFLLRQLAAPGPNFWYFRRGTGESVILPIYEALANPPAGRKPVRFEFLGRVKDVVPSADGSSIARIVIRRHARPNGDTYDPISEAAGLRYWPSGPIADRIHPDDREAIAGRDLEDWYALLPDEPGSDVVLEHGDDFDAVVLAIPPPALAHSAPSLLGDPAWEATVAGLEFIPTQGVQLWLKPDGEALGLPLRGYRTGMERWSTAEWIGPNSCWVDFSDLIAEEHWEIVHPRTLIYFCGPLDLGPDRPQPGDPADCGYPATAHGRVTEETTKMMRQLHRLLPGLDGGDHGRYSLLVSADGSNQPEGPERLSTQYLRANVFPTELYGLSRPGHLQHRRKAWESGYANLVLAGDWTFTGLNINSFEGAATSGAIASYALTGTPEKRDIIGYGFLRPDCGADRPGSPILERLTGNV